MTDLAVIDFGTGEPLEFPEKDNGSDELTVFRATDRGIYTKRWLGAGEKGKTKKATWHDVETIKVGSVLDLFDALLKIRPDYRSCVVRGRLINRKDNRGIRRSHRKNPTLEEVNRRWMMLDFDTADTIIDPDDPKAAVRYVQTRAPVLRDVTVVYQCSSSWGLRPTADAPTLKMHLWYWLTDPADSATCKAFANSLPIDVDLSIYSPSQPHYTADPIFDRKTGATEFMTDENPRIGIVHGSLDELYIGDGNANNELAYWCEQIRNIEYGEARHPIVNKAAYFLGSWAGAGYLDAEQVQSDLLHACEESDAFENERLSEIENEIKRALSDGVDKPRIVEQWKSLYIRNSEGFPKPLLSNYVTLFRHHPDTRGRFGYDLRFQQTVSTGKMPWERKDGRYPIPVEHRDVLLGTDWASRPDGGDIPTNALTVIDSALEIVGRDNEYDDVRNWIQSLPPWDGEERLSYLWTRACGADSTEYILAVARTFLISMIARGLQPGCKVDTMIILFGKQGTLKSTFFRVLSSGPGEKYFSSDIGNIGDPFSYLPTIKGKWMIEVPELAQFGGRHVEVIKSFLSKEIHTGREPYQTRATTYPAGYVLAGSTNRKEFLSDTTGNRRFHPVHVKRKIDLDWVSKYRDQLFAEAYAAYREGEKWYLEHRLESQAILEQDKYLSVDPWVDIIVRFVNAPPLHGPVNFDDTEKQQWDSVTVDDLLSQALEIPLGRIDKKTTQRLSECMQVIGWEKRRVRENGIRVYKYFRPI